MFTSYNYNDKVKEDEVSRACSAHAEKSIAYRVLMGKLEGKRLLGRPKHTLEDNIKMNLREIRRDVMDWIHLAQDTRPLASFCEHGNEPSGSIKCFEILE
jgi:hypothetical protein